MGATHTPLDLTLALGASDLNRALLDGAVGIQGAGVRCLTFPSPERHWRMFRRAEFDVAEASFGAYLSVREKRPEEFVAVPAFPHRRFRHSYVFTAAGSPLASPAELAGRRVGLRTWTNTAGVWTRGILQDEYGLDLRGVEWVVQDADTAGEVPDGFRITPVPEGRTVVEMTAKGEIDALVYPELPDVLDTPGGLRRLFADPGAEERGYFARTGIFPIMHTVVLRRELTEKNPWLPYETLRAFRAAKDRALAEVADPRRTCLAWARDAYEQQVALMGPDPWAYDVEGSRAAVATLARYAVEQGIVRRAPEPEELFHPGTLDEPPGYVRR
ncbi:PhnD/SsuA/transferrin family substrate-binding protein [Streptomyces sp. NPDC050560]|uniref:PhnD/SsuA/transferrin family substrate-binding protein n=1 Tax=Streptomyces sp. NPDC050560 TaxID=3365630 RepID=UPI00378A292A